MAQDAVSKARDVRLWVVLGLALMLMVALVVFFDFCCPGAR
jgi:hypothetical protein